MDLVSTVSCNAAAQLHLSDIGASQTRVYTYLKLYEVPLAHSVCCDDTLPQTPPVIARRTVHTLRV